MPEIFNNIFIYVKKNPKPYLLSVGIGCMGLILFTYGLWTSLAPKNTDSSVLSAQTSPISPTIPFVKTVKSIFIDIEGGLEKPGVYHLDQENRVQDALIAAGGLSANADRSWVEKHLNLAAKITDGEKIYIPRIGEVSDNSPAKSPGTPENTVADIVGTDPGSLISINTATANELHTIPGIGKKTAEKIVNNRPYTDIQELVTRKIVKKNIFEKIKNKLQL